MHAEVYTWLNFCRRYIEGVEGDLANFEVIEIGGRDVNGRAHDGFGPTLVWLVNDIAPGPDVEVVMPGHEFLIEQRGMHWDCVVSCEVFEHTNTWREIVTAAAGAVKSCGWMIVTCASPGRAPHSAIDGGAVRPDEYYANVDPVEFRVVADLAGWHVEFLEIDKSWGRPRSHTGDLFALLRHCA
jgi:hypothetical protein